MKTPKPVALVTGAARRIGAGLCRSLHEQGYDVVLHYSRSGDQALALADTLNNLRANSCLAVQADFNDPQAVTHLASVTRDWKQSLHVLVNNASSFYPTPFHKADQQAWDELFTTNVRVPYFLTQALLPLLQQSEGCVINIVDAMLDRPAPDHSLYGMTKTALVSMTRSLAKELAPTVRVAGISPGAILWPEDPPLTESAKEAILAAVPLQRQGEIEDICRTLDFLVNNASYLTGQIITVDGGRSL